MRAIAWRDAKRERTLRHTIGSNAAARVGGLPKLRATWGASEYRPAVAQILHLGKARKAKRRAAEQAQADQNAVRHGRTAEERAREDAARRRQDALLDGARREPPTVAADDDE